MQSLAILPHFVFMYVHGPALVTMTVANPFCPGAGSLTVLTLYATGSAVDWQNQIPSPSPHITALETQQ